MIVKRNGENSWWRILAQSLLALLVTGFSAVVGFLWHREDMHEQDDKKFHDEVKQIEKVQTDDIARREDADRESSRDRDEIRRRLGRVEDHQQKRLEDEARIKR